MLKSVMLCVGVFLPLMSIQGNSLASEPTTGAVAKAASVYIPITKASDARAKIKDEYIVIFNKQAVDDDIDKIRNNIDKANGNGHKKLVKYKKTKGFSGRIPPGQLKKLQENAQVSIIEENQVIELAEFPVETGDNHSVSGKQVDTLRTTENTVAESWGLDRLDQEDLPLDGYFNNPHTGAGVHAYIIDSGIHLSHYDFGGRAVWDFTASTVDDGNADNDGHGTHMAGTIGGTTFGIAPQSTLHAVKVLSGDRVGTTAGLIEGIEYVTENHQKPAVALIGIFFKYSEAVNNAVATSSAAGVSYALPVGDYVRDACNYSPSSTNMIDDGVISVAPTRDNDNASIYTNYGTCVDIYAPGLYIRSAWKSADWANNTFSHSPTAAAHITGVAAAILGNDASCTPAQIKQKILNSGRVGTLTNVPETSPDLLVALPDSSRCGEVNFEDMFFDYDHLIQISVNGSANIEFVLEGSVQGAAPYVLNGSLEWDVTLNAYVYSPNAGFAGVDGFTYVVGGQTYTVRIEVGLSDSSAPVEADASEFDQLDVQQVMLSNGDTLMVWREFDGAQHSIYYQRFSVTGLALTARTLVHVSTSNQFAPTVSATINAGFMIGWQQDNDLFALTFDAANVSVSGLITISAAIGVQANLSLVTLGNGSIVATWNDVETSQAFATIYGADGSVISANISLFADVFVQGTDVAHSVTVSARSSGSFMVAAMINNQVVARHYNALGVAVNATVVVSELSTNVIDATYAVGFTRQVSITEITAGANAGGYVVAWTSTAGQDGDGLAVVGRVYSSIDVALTAELVLSDSLVGDQTGIQVIGLENGGFMAVYLSGNKAVAHRFDANWTAIEAEFVISHHWSVSQGGAIFVAKYRGRFVVSFSQRLVAGVYQAVAYPIVVGTVNADILAGNLGNNILFGTGLVGDNWINGGNGADSIFDATYGYGGNGDDIFYGGVNLYGGAGWDTFYGGVNVYGEAGPDDFHVIAGGTTINGGDGFDAVFFAGLDSDFTVVDDGNGQYTVTDNRAGSPLGVTVLVDVETLEFVNTRTLLTVAAQPWDHLVQVEVNGSVVLKLITGNVRAQPNYGLLKWKVEHGAFVYTPNTDFEGVDRIRYVGPDGELDEIRIEVGSQGVTTAFNPPEPDSTDTNQLDPQGISLDNGTSVLLWREFDGVNSILYFQLFDNFGVEIDTKVRVDNVNGQYQPTIAKTLAGGFVIGWQQGGDLFAREYDVAGAATGISVAIANAGVQANLTVNVLANGYWLLGWDDVDTGVVYTALYSPLGAQVSAHVAVFAHFALTNPGPQSSLAIMPQAHGGYVAAAIINGVVVTQHFSHTGLTIGEPNTVSGTVTTTIADPDYHFVQLHLTELDNGHYVVSWTSTGDVDGFGMSVLARIYNPYGQATTDVYVLSEIVVGDQKAVRIHAFAGARFMATWQSGRKAVARIFDFNGNPTTTEFGLVVSVHGLIAQPYPFDLVDGRVGVAYVIKLNNSFRIVIAPMTVGTPREDVLIGDANPNIFIGLDGDDKIWGKEGDDTIIDPGEGYGGDGDDRFYAGIVLDGGAGRDRFYGGVDIKGGADNDEYYGGVGLTLNASFDGGEGYDVAIIDGPKDGYTINADPNGSYLLSSVTPGNSLDLELWQAAVVEFSDGRVMLEGPPSVPDTHVDVALGGNTVLAIIPGGEDAVITDHPEHGTLTFDINIGEWVYTPDDGYIGPDSFTYIDAEGNPQTVALSVGLDVSTNFTVDGSPFEQLDPAIAILEDGSAVVAWAEFDGSSNAVYYQRFDGNGVAISARTPVYADTGVTSQEGPTIVPLGGGGFVLGWTQDETDVVALRFGPDGQFIGEPQNLDQTTGVQVDITLANLANGDIVAVYTDLTNGKPMAAILDDRGVQVEANIELFAHLVNNDDGQHITIMPSEDGSFVVATVIEDQILAQPYSITGDPIGNVEVVATLDAEVNIADLKLTPVDGGGFAIAWNSQVNVDDYEGELWARVYGPDRLVVTDPVKVNDLHFVVDFDIAPMADGNFIAIWQTAPDTGSKIVGRIIGDEGFTTSVEFELHKNIFGPQSGPDIVILPNERLGVAYSNHIGGTAGVSTLTIAGGHDTDDIMQGDYEANILIGLAGNNTIYAGGDRDIVLHAYIGYGEDGGDTFYAGRTLYGGAGNDTFYGGVNVYGGTGADDMYVYGAHGVYHGGAGGNLEVDFDVAIFNGIASDYEVVENQDGSFTVTDLRDGSPNGVSTLIDVEVIEYADGRQQLEAYVPNGDIKVHVGIDGVINIDFVIGPDFVQPEFGTITWNAELNIHFYEPNGNYDGSDFFTYTDEFGVQHTVQISQGERVNVAGVDSQGNAQLDSQMTVLANGDTLIVWREIVGGKYVVFYQRINADDEVVVARTQLHVSTINQSIPQVVATNTGGFMIAWQELSSLYIRLFSATNVAGSVETITETVGSLSELTMVTLANGTIVVSWLNATDGQVYANVYAADGTLLLWHIRLFASAFGDVTTTAFASTLLMLHDGSFIAGGIVNNQVIMQHYNHLGIPLSEAIMVSEYNTDATDELAQISMTELVGGQIVIGWTSTAGQDGYGTSVIQRVYDANLVAITSEVILSQTVIDNQNAVRVQALNNGNYIAVWQSATADGNWRLMGRLFNGAGAALSVEFSVVVLAQSIEFNADLIVLDNGFVKVSYTSEVTGIASVRIKTLLIGTDSDDALIGGSDHDVLIGLGGNDHLTGGSGDDQIIGASEGYGGLGSDSFYGGVTVYGQEGNDNFYFEGNGVLGQDATIDGGADEDVLFVSGNFADYSIVSNNDGSFTITDNRVGSPDGTIVLIDVEIVEFIDQRHTLTAQVVAGVPHLVQVALSGSVNIHFVTGSITVQPQNGVLTFDGAQGVWIYTANNGYVGGDSFTYVDSEGVTHTVAVEVGLPSNGFSFSATVSSTVLKESNVTALADGSSIIVWQEYVSARYHVMFQRFDALGVAETGPIQVDTTVTHQYRPDAIATDDGGFIIAYRKNSNIYAQRFDASSLAIGGLIDVATTASVENDVSMALLNNGYFAVAWDNASTYKAQAKVFDASGTPASDTVNLFSSVTGYQYEVIIEPSSDGGFIAAAIVNKSIVTGRFNHLGELVGSEVVVNSLNTNYHDENKQIAITELSDGGYAVAWTSSAGQDGSYNAVVGRIVDAEGNLAGDEFVLSTYVTTDQEAVRLVGREGGFIAAWQSMGVDGFEEGIAVRLFNNIGSATSSEIIVNRSFPGAQLDPYISILADGRVAVAYIDGKTNTQVRVVLLSPGSHNADVIQGDDGDNLITGNGGNDVVYGGAGNDSIYDAATVYAGSGHDSIYGASEVYGQAGNDNIYATGNSIIDGGADYDVVFLTGNRANYTVIDNGNGTFTVTGIDGTSYTLTDVEVIEFADDRQVIADVAPVQTWDHLVQAAVNGSVEMTFVTANQPQAPSSGSLSFNGSAYVYTPSADFVGVDRFVYVDNQSVSRTVQVEVGMTSHSSSILVDDDSIAHKDSTVTVLSNGDILVLWREYWVPEYQYRLLMRRFDSNGKALTDAVEAYHYGQSIDYYDVTAIDNGGFNITWIQKSATEVYSLAFDAQNQAQGEPVEVDVVYGSFKDVTGIQLTNGSMVVAWQHSDIAKARIVSADGEMLTGEIQLFSHITGSEYELLIEPLADGGFYGVVSIGYKIYAQRFNHLGETLGNVVLVNTTNNLKFAEQQMFSLTQLNDGNVVIAWTSVVAQDGDSYTAMARVFNLAGTPVSDEIQLNQFSEDKQQEVRVVSLANGGFAAIWESDGGDTHGYGIMARRFDANGNATSEEYRAVADWMYEQDLPHIAKTSDGRMVVSYLDNTSGTLTTKLGFMSASTQGADVLHGDANDNVMVANGGADISYGHEGDDKIYNSATVYGGNGDDYIYGGSAIYGQAGNDNIYGVEDATIDGGADYDVVTLSGNRIDYTVINNGGNNYSVTGTDGSSYTLVDVEVIEFADDRQVIANVTPVNTWDHLVQVATNGSVELSFVTANQTLAPTDGSLTHNGSVYVYTPDANFVGVDRFSYLDGQSVNRTVQVEVGLASHGTSVLTDEGSIAHKDSTVIVLANGDVMAFWREYWVPEYQYRLIMRRFDSNGNALGEEQEAFYHGASIDYYDVTALSDGGFMINWIQQSATQVHSLRFDANAVAVAAPVEVDVVYGSFADVSGVELTNGSVVVTWQHSDIAKARIMSATGKALTTEIQIFSGIAGSEYELQITPLADGGFYGVVSIGYKIYGQRFNHLGETIGNIVLINQVNNLRFNEQFMLDVVQLTSGDIAVSWTSVIAQDGDSYSAIARVFDLAGNPVSEQIQLNQYVAGKQQEVRIAALNNGGFIAVWESDDADGHGKGIMARRFDALGAPTSEEYSATLDWPYEQTLPQLAVTNDGRIVVSYLDNASGLLTTRMAFISATTQGLDVLQGTDGDNVINGNGGNTTVNAGSGDDTIYDVATVYAGSGDDSIYGGTMVNGEAGNDNIYVQTITGIFDGGSGYDAVFFSGNRSDYTVIDNGDGTFSVHGIDNSSYTLIDVEVIEFADDRQVIATVTPVQTWDHLVQVAVNGSVEMGFVSANQPQLPANGSLSYNGSAYVYTPSTNFVGVDHFVYVDGQNVSRDVQVAVGMTSHGESVLVDDGDIAHKDSTVIVLGNGDVMVFWREYWVPEYQYRLLMRRFDSNGNALTDKQVAFYHGASVDYYDVTAMSDGGFMINWIQQSATQVHSLRFDANAQAVATPFEVDVVYGSFNDVTGVELTNGSIVVAWQHSDKAKARVFSAVGKPLTHEVELFADIAGSEYELKIEALADGGFYAVVSIGYKVYAQRFNHMGVTIGDAVIINEVNNLPFKERAMFDVVQLTSGDMAISWTSIVTQDGDSYGAIARVFDLAGNPVSDQIQLNQYTKGKQQEVRLVALNNGGFIAAWESDGADSHDIGIMARRFDENGVATSDEFFATIDRLYKQTLPEMAATIDNRLVLSYIDSTDTLLKTRMAFMSAATAGTDVLQGNSNDDMIVGNGGDDVVYGHGGEDIIFDAAVVYAGEGDDSVHNGDVVYGQGGNDNIYLKEQTGVADGGAGYDVAFVTGNRIDYTLLDNGNGNYTLSGIDGSTYTLNDIEVIEYADDRQVLVPQASVAIEEHLVQVAANDSVEMTFVSSAYAIAQDPSLGYLSVSGGHYMYTSSGNVGVDSFVYTDGQGIDRTVRVEVGLAQGTIAIDDTSRSHKDATNTVLANGDILVVWREYYVPEYEYRMIMQRFDSQGVAKTPVTEVYYHGGSVGYYDVTPTADGGYVFSWIQTSNTQLYSLRYDANNQAIGTPVEVDIVYGSFNDVTVVELTNGYIVTSWQHSDKAKVRVQNAQGKLMTSEIEIFADIAGSEYETKIIALKDGGFYAVGSIGYKVYGQRFNHLAQPIGDAVIINSTNNLAFKLIQMFSLAQLNDGNIAISWTSIVAQDGSSYSAIARIIDVYGQPVSEQIQLNEFVTGKQQEVRVAAVNTGGFIAVWESDDADGDDWGIMARQFDAQGNALSSEYRATTDWQNKQTIPQLSTTKDGRVVMSYIYTESGVQQTMMTYLSPATANADVVQGDDNDNQISAGAGINMLYGKAGNDNFYGPYEAGTEIDGGLDSDSVYFTGAAADYSVVNQGANYLVTDNRTDSPDGVVKLFNVETLVFSDSQMSL